MLAQYIGETDREVFVIAMLTVRHRVLGLHTVSVGCLTSSLVHPREVFRPAIMAGFCAALLLAHNHPSGDPEPSAEDLALTRRLAAAGTLLGIEVLDHLILGEAGRFVSLKERGRPVRPAPAIGAARPGRATRALEVACPRCSARRRHAVPPAVGHRSPEIHVEREQLAVDGGHLSAACPDPARLAGRASPTSDHHSAAAARSSEPLLWEELLGTEPSPETRRRDDDLP